MGALGANGVLKCNCKIYINCCIIVIVKMREWVLGRIDPRAWIRARRRTEEACSAPAAALRTRVADPCPHPAAAPERAVAEIARREALAELGATCCAPRQVHTLPQTWAMMWLTSRRCWMRACKQAAAEETAVVGVTRVEVGGVNFVDHGA